MRVLTGSDMTDYIEAQRELQRKAFGLYFNSMKPEATRDYIRTNVLAAQVELAEFIQELQWKPWATYETPSLFPNPIPEARARAVEELVDVFHFWLNLVIALGYSGEELEAAYFRKRDVNFRRQSHTEAV